ncbi:MAG TPA: hypothetical protein VEG66_04715 [Thermoplasmata archaeon]|nr:hypothetical protein [Thermoplasmata archaeon]
MLRKVGGPLFLYHVLILLGAYLIVWGWIQRTPAWEIVGAVLVAAGIATEVTVLAWSARLVRRTAARQGPTRRSTRELPRETWLCVRCGRSESGPCPTCPRCGGTVVKVAAPDGE